MTTPRPQWHYGDHPPACTCVSCVARRRGPRPGRQVWRGRDISPGAGPSHSPSHASATVPPPAKRGAKGWMAFLFLLGLVAGGIAVWWWSTGYPNLDQTTATVEPVATNVEREPAVPSPTPVPVIVPAPSPTPRGTGNEPIKQAVLPTTTSPSTAAQPETPPRATVKTTAASPTVIPTVTPVAVPTSVPTGAPTPTPVETPCHLLSPIEIMRCVDQGKLTEEEAVAILKERKRAAQDDHGPLPTATPETTATVEPKVTPLAVTIAPPKVILPEPVLSTPDPTPSTPAPPSGNQPTLAPESESVPPGAEPSFPYVAGARLDVDEVERRIIEFTNRERSDAGLSPLSHDPVISDISRAHSTNMVESGIFNHRIDGDGPTDRALDAGYDCRADLSGGRYSYGLAENIAERPRVRRWTGTTSEGRTSWRPVIFSADAEEMAMGLMQQWMNSPGHRENILHRTYHRIGVGIHIKESPNYGYQNETVFATQNFSSCK